MPCSTTVVGVRAVVPHQVVEVRDVRRAAGRRGRPAGAGCSRRCRRAGRCARGTPPAGRGRAAGPATARERRPPRAAAGPPRRRRASASSAGETSTADAGQSHAAGRPPPTARARAASGAGSVPALDERRGPGAVHVPDEDVHEAGVGALGMGEEVAAWFAGSNHSETTATLRREIRLVVYLLSLLPPGQGRQSPRTDPVSPRRNSWFDGMRRASIADEPGPDPVK